MKNNLYFKQLKISFFTEGNELIYWLEKFPLSKKLVNDSWYRNNDLKLVLSVINRIRKTVINFILGMLAVFVTVAFPCMIFESVSMIRDNPGLLFHILFWVFCVFGGLSNVSIVHRFHEKNDYIMLHVMHTPAKEYYMMVYARRILKTFADFFVLIFFGGLRTYLICCAYVICFRMTGEAAAVLSFDHPKLKRLHIWLKRLTFIAAVAVGEVMTVIKLGNVHTYEIMTSVPGIVLTLSAAVISFICIVRYRRYRLIAKELVKYELVDSLNEIEKDSKKNVKANLVMNAGDEKAMLKAGTGKYENKKGYDYLNALFFARHRHLFFKKAVFKSGAVLLAAVIIAVIHAFLPQFGVTEDFMIIVRTAPAMLYWLYILSSGQVICQSLFYDCDRSLLKYGYYRQGRAVLENFRHRIRYIILIDLIPSLMLCIIPFEFMLINKRPDYLVTVCIICVGFLSASLFFSVFHTMMYYIFQPFTEDMTVHGKAYSIISWLMILAAYIFYMTSTNGNWTQRSLIIFFTVFSVTAVLFIPVSLILVYKIAPKSFKLK